jgi:HlyD family secretion protein
MLAQSQLDQVAASPQSEEIEQMEANLRAAEAQVSAAAADLDQVMKGASDAQIVGAQAQVASAELQVKIAQDAYDKTVRETDDEDRIESANYDLFGAKEALKAAEAELNRLLAGASNDAVRAAQASLQVATAQRDAAQAQLDLLIAGPTEEQLADAEAKVNQARAALESARITQENAELVAPFDGVVAAVNIASGELPSTLLAPIELLDTSRYVTVVGVDEVDIGQLVEGMPVEVTVEALPDVVIEGAIERIATVASVEGGVVYYDVTVALESTDMAIRADMTADARFVISELDDVLMIPTWVVRVDQTTGQTYVDVPESDSYERVDVQLGARYEGYVQVIEGLNEGDEVFYVIDSEFGSMADGG